MPSEPLRRLAHSLACALAVLCAAVAPCDAAQTWPPHTQTFVVPVERTAGTCPGRVRIALRTQRYAGGAEFTVTVAARRFVKPPVAFRRAAHRITFTAALAAPFGTCEAAGRLERDGSAYAMTWHAGSWRFALLPSKELQVMRIGAGVDPSVVLAVAD